ncbi:ATP-dependent DNA ligase [Methanoplanus sp. FWC-SCC4]|uniref:ATP-dependent DNA ligase n=1 Tax=Methanochimaera problematica TaxID=2609417 RepID=A0AA97FCZ5_9EURY|nr:DNA polymerase ligase N-terminal domain-containing protein [Methanoplanus sp. FWC-SCC4]WOF17230.1 ATP-dependent DNA ligase [Methanoplanus sp. FWC-SCC4]
MAEDESPEKLRFVVHDHHSKNHHYDLRLEKDGILKCWAVPKGVPEIPGEKHLSIDSGDHELSALTFSGIIPAGEYGAGEILIDDSGTYESLSWDEKKIEFFLHGEKYRGKYVLVRFKRAGEGNWLLMKAK